MVSIHRPLGYGPSTLPLRHSALRPKHVTNIPLTVLGSTPLTLENCKGGVGEGYLFQYFGYKMPTVWINVATRIRENK